MKLRGDHCQCPTCGEYFNSTYAFDKHRTGTHGVDRRCLGACEMIERGMGISSTGWWLSKAHDRPIAAGHSILGAANDLDGT